MKKVELTFNPTKPLPPLESVLPTPPEPEHIPFRFRLANQMTFIFAYVVLLLILIQGVIVVQVVQDALEKRVIREQSLAARSGGAQITQYLAEQRGRLSQVLNAGTSFESDEVSVQDMVTMTLTLNPSVLELLLVDEFGRVIAHDSQPDEASLILTDGVDATYQNAPWYLTARTGQDYIGDIRLGVTDMPSVNLSGRLSTGNLPRYIIVGRVDASPVCELMQHTVRSDDERMVLMIRGQTEPLCGATSTIVADATEARDVSISLTLVNVGHPFSGQYESPPLGTVLGASIPIDGTSWVLVNEVRADVAMQDIRQVVLIIIGLFLAGTVIALAMGRVLTAQIANPIRRLTEAVRELEANQVPKMVDVHNRSEVGVLAKAFNRMSQVIAERERELASVNRALRVRTDELEDLSRRTISAEEVERQRVSRELHDGFGQTLNALKMTLGVGRNLAQTQQLRGLLSEAAQITDLAIDEVHAISQNLRPTLLDDLGLRAAIEWYLKDFEIRYHIDVEFATDDDSRWNLTNERIITAYRFIQETINNVRKHSRATLVQVRIKKRGQSLFLMVKDNGNGFDLNQISHERGRVSLGIRGLRERLSLVGGEFILDSRPGGGTTVVAMLPMSASGIMQENERGMK